MKSKYSFYSKLIILVFFLSSISFSQNINDALRLGLGGLGSNARALGMGNSYIGLSDDASAAYFNPAGFGLLKRLEFSGGLDYSNFSNSTDFLGNNTNYSNSTTRLSRLSFALPVPTVRGSLVFGISFNTVKDFTGALKFDGFNNGNTSMIQDLNENTNVPYDLYLTDTSFNTPINGRLNQSGNILNSGSINNWTFSGAIEAAKNLFVGLNLNIISGSYTSNNDYYEDDTRNIYQGETSPGDPETLDFRTFHLNRILDWDLSGWDFKAGMIYEFNEYGRFGLTVQFPRFFTVKEKFTVNGSSEFANAVFDLNSEDYSDQVKYDIISPFELGGGFSFNFKGLILNAEATLIDYSQLEFDDPEGINAQDIESLNKNIKEQLGSVLNYNFGLEYTLPKIGLRFRAGFLTKPSAYKDDPSEFNRKYFTAGFGFLAQETIGIDVGYAHGWWKDFGDNYGSNVSRTFQDVTLDKIILTATYRF